MWCGHLITYLLEGVLQMPSMHVHLGEEGDTELGGFYCIPSVLGRPWDPPGGVGKYFFERGMSGVPCLPPCCQYNAVLDKGRFPFRFFFSGQNIENQPQRIPLQWPKHNRLLSKLLIQTTSPLSSDRNDSVTGQIDSWIEGLSIYSN